MNPVPPVIATFIEPNAGFPALRPTMHRQRFLRRELLAFLRFLSRHPALGAVANMLMEAPAEFSENHVTKLGGFVALIARLSLLRPAVPRSGGALFRTGVGSDVPSPAAASGETTRERDILL